MWLKGLSTRKASELGASLADQLAPAESDSSGERKTTRLGAKGGQLQTFLQSVDREALPLQLGIFRRAKLASSFKWRLIDNGVEPEVVEELTRMLVMRLTVKSLGATVNEASEALSPAQPGSGATSAKSLLARADECATRGAHAEAINGYQEFLKVKPRHPLACNNLGVALLSLGHYREAEEQFRRAVGIQSTYVDAQFNLGTLLRNTGRIVESEQPLRRASKLDPKHVEAQVSLGMTLVLLGRLRDAQDCFDRVLKVAPRHGRALYGSGQVANIEGRFEDAESLFKRALVFEQRMPGAWAALAHLRKMTSSDGAWLKSSERIASSGLLPLEEVDLRFAIGKYYDDTGDFERAFQSYKRANDLLKTFAEPYVRHARVRFIDDTIRVYSRESFASLEGGASDSTRPVFVTGMMRSGTSLVEQIISSHPAVRGAGELPFWNDAARKYQDILRNRWLGEKLKKQLAESYLHVLDAHSRDALRVVDKSTFNTDHLGLIHSVFPKARVIYVRRDPVDTCLSCYFQQFSTAHNFTMDLGDLAHYYSEHQRLVAHWRAVLPPATLLEVPYAELVADQEKWTRRIVEFLDLEWDDRCLDFHKTQRPVLTASFWQVRQRIYQSSLDRGRHYRKFLGPLLELRQPT
jgi:tetratricopeptide (TPR) repeat protein